jgi:MoaA/NifB/PqqE/SkfB family radical SAM enzyme
MISAIDDMVKLGVKAINWSGGGEPTLHPDFAYFVDYAAFKGLKQGLFTNAYKDIPLQDRFSWIRISLTDKGFGRIKIPHVPYGICVNQVPEQEEEDLIGLCSWAEMIGARYFQIRPALSGSYKKQSIMKAPKYLEGYKTNKFNVFVTDYKYDEATRSRDYRDCYGYHFCPSIDWRGQVAVCLYLAHKKEYVLGDLKKMSLLKIWPKIKKRMRVIEECQNCCKNHEINKILYRAKNISMVDFI